jgi:hypothetical protein
MASFGCDEDMLVWAKTTPEQMQQVKLTHGQKQLQTQMSLHEFINSHLSIRGQI